MKVEDAIKKFVTSGQFRKLSSSSQRHYIAGLDVFANEFKGRDIESIRRAEIISCKDSMDETPGKANQFIRVTSAFFTYSIDMEIVSSNPCHRISKNKINPIPRWEVDQIKKVIGLGNRIVSTAVALSWYTGQRQGDVLSMRWKDIDKSRPDILNVKQSKTGKILEIKIHPSLKKILDGLDKEGDYIVSGAHKISPPAFRSYFTRTIRKNGIDLPFHGIRKAVAANLAENGRSANEIAALLGHSTLSMVTLYTKDANSKKMIAAAVDSMD